MSYRKSAASFHSAAEPKGCDAVCQRTRLSSPALSRTMVRQQPGALRERLRRALLATGFTFNPTNVANRRSGNEGRPIVDPDGTIHRLAGTTQDVTEQRMIELQLAQAQKMEALGTLTGGMAHDFNNGLGVIIGNLELLRRRFAADSLELELCDDAMDGAARCADMIKRLLAFARRRPLRAQPTDVNALVGDVARLLGRTLREDIVLRLELATGCWPVIADPAQLEAALVNLATNARDAMPNGGHLAISTKNVTLDGIYVALQSHVISGDFVVIEVADTGIGMSPETISHIFEPFFTTKAPGSGTGLGLAMTFGFVKQSGGQLEVESEPGRGATFRISLPRGDAQPTIPAIVPATARAIGGTEIVLLVEDNTRLRHIAARELSELGYQVHEARNADSALAILAGGVPVDILLTDVVMPGPLDGLDLALAATERPR